MENKDEKYHKLFESVEAKKTALIKAKTKLEEYENSAIIPDLKKKYEGKYFKYRNSYSLPKSENDKWWIYYRVSRISNVYYAEGVSFQNDKVGKLEYNFEKHISLNLLQIEITKKEFESELKKFISKIK